VTPLTTASCSRSASGSRSLAELTLVSANLHWGFGYGRTYRRAYDVVDALVGFEADVLVLPESFRPDSGPGMLDALASAGYQVETVPIMRHELWHSSTSGRGWRPSPGIWCLAIASRLPVLERRELPMGKVFHDSAGPRSALQVDVDVDGRRLHVVGLHVSSKLYFGGPFVHLRALRPLLPQGPDPAVIAGDFNLWGPGVVSILRGWRRTVRGTTYPAHRPHSQIDHILVNRAVECLDAEVLPPYGSDHLAVRARLSVESDVPASPR
jgi:endonuclease/exonuclease/phosphatase family metal-dependent hydrolase